MKRIALALVLCASAAPALAGGYSFDLPNLTYPRPVPPVTSQGCVTPADPAATGCEKS